MKCRDCRSDYSEYLDGRLSDARTRQFEEHVQGCRECSTLLDALMEVRKTLSGLEQRKTSDSFSFNMKRLLQEETEKEHTWTSRMRSRLRPIHQTIWAASISAAAALILTFTVGMSWYSNAAVAQSESSREADSMEYVHYVMDNVPLTGDSVDTYSTSDSTSVAENTPETTENSPVSASF